MRRLTHGLTPTAIPGGVATIASRTATNVSTDAANWQQEVRERNRRLALKQQAELAAQYEQRYAPTSTSYLSSAAQTTYSKEFEARRRAFDESFPQQHRSHQQIPTWADNPSGPSTPTTSSKAPYTQEWSRANVEHEARVAIAREARIRAEREEQERLRQQEQEAILAQVQAKREADDRQARLTQQQQKPPVAVVPSMHDQPLPSTALPSVAHTPTLPKKDAFRDQATSQSKQLEQQKAKWDQTQRKLQQQREEFERAKKLQEEQELQERQRQETEKKLLAEQAEKEAQQERLKQSEKDRLAKELQHIETLRVAQEERRQKDLADRQRHREEIARLDRQLETFRTLPTKPTHQPSVPEEIEFSNSRDATPSRSTTPPNSPTALQAAQTAISATALAFGRSTHGTGSKKSSATPTPWYLQNFDDDDARSENSDTNYRLQRHDPEVLALVPTEATLTHATSSANFPPQREDTAVFHPDSSGLVRSPSHSPVPSLSEADHSLAPTHPSPSRQKSAAVISLGSGSDKELYTIAKTSDEKGEIEVSESKLIAIREDAQIGEGNILQTIETALFNAANRMQTEGVKLTNHDIVCAIMLADKYNGFRNITEDQRHLMKEDIVRLFPKDDDQQMSTQEAAEKMEQLAKFSGYFQQGNDKFPGTRELGLITGREGKTTALRLSRVGATFAEAIGENILTDSEYDGGFEAIKSALDSKPLTTEADKTKTILAPQEIEQVANPNSFVARFGSASPARLPSIPRSGIER